MERKYWLEAGSQVMDVKLGKGIRLSRVRISTQNLRFTVELSGSELFKEGMTGGWAGSAPADRLKGPAGFVCVWPEHMWR